jgi:hypothetical protein
MFIVIHDPLATSFPLPALLHPHPLNNDVCKEVDETFHYPGAEAKHLGSSAYDEVIFAQPLTTYYTHEREMNLYMNLISRVDPLHSGDEFSTGYDYYLHDALLSIQSQPAFQVEGDLDQELKVRQALKHHMNVNDLIFSRILDSLRCFFANTPDYNMALTGFLAKLALHPDRSLAGWLTFALGEVDSKHARDENSTYGIDDDDRSMDFKIEENLVYETNILPAASMDQNSRPIVHTIYHGLVNQLERYRQLVEDFDKFLLVRRQGLLFSENLTDALNPALDVSSEDSLQSHNPVPQVPQTPTKAKPKAKGASSLVSFLTPRKNKPPAPVVSGPTTTPYLQDANGKDNTVSASPFGSHYQQTGSIKVEPLVAPIPSTGPWIPVHTRKWNVGEEDVFGSGWSERPSDAIHHEGGFNALGEGTAPGGEEEYSQSVKGKTITLSQLLDNVVILEESIKELVAIIHARRSLGIDSIRYL